jgi:transposase InsO family protein
MRAWCFPTRKHGSSEAFPGDGWTPRFLQRDRDKIFGWAFRHEVKTLGIEELISAPSWPWQNAFVVRVIGTLRRECTDHIIPLGEKHLLRTIREFVAFYNEGRVHQSLERNSPIARKLQRRGEVIAKPVLGGLHHRYARAA